MLLTIRRIAEAVLVAVLTRFVINLFVPSFRGNTFSTEAPVEWKFVASTDLDHDSRDPREFLWTSYLQTGRIVRDPATNNFSIHLGTRTTLTSRLSYKNRSMELSAMEFFGDRLMAFCDRSGIMYEIDPKHQQAYPHTMIRTGDGRRAVPQKTEWATLKDGLLYIGSNGKEWTDNGVIKHEDFKWIKVMRTYEDMDNIMWRDFFERLRAYANCSYPGYLIHESLAWEPRTRQWIVLPRKLSTRTPYMEDTDEKLSGNTMFIVSEDLMTIRHRAVGPLELEWGFTDVKPLLPTHKSLPVLFLGVKSREVAGSVVGSKLCVFDIEGKLYTDGFVMMPSELKFEGLAVVPDSYEYKSLL